MDTPIRILPPKIRPPRPRDKRIRRPRLLARLDAIDTKLTLIVAPAGFGKSTLLTRWISESEKPVAWLSLGAEDDSLSVFLAYITESIASTDADHAVGAQDDAALRGRVARSPAAAAVLDQLTRNQMPWTLVIDDYHVITNTDIHRFVTTLVDTMPESCRLIIAARVEPPLAVARLQVNDDLTLLTGNDLRATSSECAEILNQYSVGATELQTLAIAERTAGWLAALHLVALACESESLDRVIESLRVIEGERDLLSDYLLQEVLSDQSPEMWRFLLQISVLDRFTAEICYAVTGNASARQLLDQARRRGLFLIDLDDSRTWFRFHSLFRDFLRRELALEVDPLTIPPLHAAASRWFREHELFSEALFHAIQGEEWTEAASMITASAAHMFATRGLDVVWDWLQSYPRDVLLSDPDLSSIAAYALVRQGRFAESTPYLEAAERAWQDAQHTFGLATIEGARGARARFRDDADALVAHAVAGIRLATGEQAPGPDGTFFAVQPRLLKYEGTWLAQVPHQIPYMHLALGLLYQGRIAEGERLAQRIRDVYISDGYIHTLTAANLLVALAHLASGRLLEAESVARPIAALDPGDLPVERATGVVTLAEILYEWNRLDEAILLLEDGVHMHTLAQSSLLDSDLHIQLARTRWAKGDAAGTHAALTEVVASASALQNHFLLHQAEALRASIAIATGDLDFTRNWAIARGLFSESAHENATMDEAMTLARLHIAVGDADQAIQLLEGLRAAAERDARLHDLIHVLVLESLAYLDQFELDQAVDVLGQALARSETGRYIRVYIDEGGPMLRLLRIAHRRGTNVPYIEELLAAAGETPGALTRVTHVELVEPITPREVDVLRLIALGLTNKEIGEELYVSVATVKRHITNLNGKLGVSSRTEAVQKARRLKLLPTGGASSRRLVSDSTLD